MLPSGKPVRDESGEVMDFDFKDMIKLGNAALKTGFRFILGGFVAGLKKEAKRDIISFGQGCQCYII